MQVKLDQIDLDRVDGLARGAGAVGVRDQILGDQRDAQSNDDDRDFEAKPLPAVEIADLTKETHSISPANI
jgi:hypothetical protein